MAVTNIHSIRSTASKAIRYIIDPAKTNNGKYIESFMCEGNAEQAARQFNEFKERFGTVRSIILAKHIIQSFAPNEVTPEYAMYIAQELCEKLLKNQYQYIIAVHNDHDHIHSHIIFNNVNMETGRTFETEENQGKKTDRSWAKLRKISDDICRKYNLSVIENPEISKGKNHYEWEKNKAGTSWKAKLKYIIDQIVKESEDFDDFLRLCKERGIEIVYNPDHKIDLKFRLAGQQRFTRAKTLGWYYETPQIIRRIKMYKDIMNYTPKTKIIRTDTEKMEQSPALERWADIKNMQTASKAINTVTSYTEKDKKSIEGKLMGNHLRKGILADKIDKLSIQIEELSEKIKVSKKYIKLKPVNDKLKSLTGREKKRFEKERQSDIYEYKETVKKMKELFPDGHAQKPDEMIKQRQALIDERDACRKEYAEVKAQITELEKARKTIEDYLHNERAASRKRNNHLE